MSEHMEQVKFVAWFRKNFNEHKIFSVPNGGYRGDKKSAAITGARLKAEGLLRGVHDLYIRRFQLWIEMKEDHTKKPTKEQKEWGEYVTSLGDTWIVGHGFEDAKSKTLAYLKQRYNVEMNNNNI
jgi:hypothetical protein